MATPACSKKPFSRATKIGRFGAPGKQMSSMVGVDTVSSPWLCCHLFFLVFGVLDGGPHVERRRRHPAVADAVDAERVHDGADHDGRRRGRAAFAAGLDAERIGR